MKVIKKNMIKKSVASAMLAGALSLVAGSAFAASSIVDNVKTGCKAELDKYCKDVTPGEGRVLACLTAFEDKLSGHCEYALYQAAADLEAFAAAIRHVATECKDDLLKHCGDVEVGQGRVAQCLKKNDATLAPTCKQAIKDTQMQTN